MTIVDRHDGKEYQIIFENAIEGIFQSSLDGHFLKVNPAMANIYGYDSPEEMLSSIENIEKQIYVNAHQRQEFLQALQDSGFVDRFEDQNYRKDGSIFWTQTNARIVRDAEGNALFIEGFTTDITSRKEAELALQASEERYRALMERLPGAVFLDAPNDPEHNVFISSKIEDILGYSPEEWMKDLAWSKLIHPEDRERILAESRKTDETGEPFRQEYRFQKKDGQYTWIREESSLIKDEHGKPLFWQGFLLDISDQKEAESAIKQSEEQFKRIFQANPIASCIATLEDGRFIAANNAYLRLSGFKPEDFIGRTSTELGFINASRRKKLVARLKKEKSIRNEDGKLITKSGEIRNTQEFFDLISFDGQDCILSMFYDTTDQIKAQQALLENEERYRQLFEAESDAIFLIENQGGNILEVNEAATALYGYSKEELLRMKNSDLSAEPEETRKVTKNTPIIQEDVVFIPLRFHRKKDGAVFPVEITGRFFEWRGRPVHIAAIRDITERKKSEEALQRQLEELTILHDIALAASSSKSLDELIKRATDIIYASLHPDNCGVELVTESGDGYQAHPSYRGASKDEIRMLLPLSKGITGKVISTGKPILLGDTSQASAYIEITAGVRSELCVPIKIQERVIGAFNIESRQADAYTKSDERLLNTIAGTLAAAIEQLRLFEMSQRHLQELTILNTVSLASTRAINLDELIENVTQIIGESLYPDNFGVLLLNEDGSALIPHPSYRGISHGDFPKKLSLNQGISGEVAKSGKPIRIANVRTNKQYIEVTSQVRSELCVPINLSERILGVINAESVRINAFTQDDEQLLTTIAGTLATAIEKLRLLDAEKKRRQEAEILLEATTKLTTSLNLENLLESILELISKIVPYDTASIAMDQEGKLLIVAEKGFPKGYNVIGRQLGHSEKWLLLSATHQPYIVSDAQLEPRLEHWEGSEYIRGWMGVPMVVHDKLIGYINLESHTPNSFTKKDAILAQTFANSAAVAIENARLFDVERKSRERAEALREATAVLTTSIELESLYGIILDSLTKLLPFDSASIEIFYDGYSEIVAGRSLKNIHMCIGERFQYDAAKWGALESLREPIIIPDVRNDDRFEKTTGTKHIRGWMGVPMIVQDRLVGFLNFDSSTENFFTPDHAALAQTYGNQAAIAIENARLFQEESQRSRIIEAMANIANELAIEHEIIPALDKITHRALGLLQASTVAIYLLQEDNKTIKVVTAQGTYREQLLLHTLQLGTGITGNIMATGKPEIIDDMLNDSRRVTVPGTPEEDAQRDTIMSAPLILRGRTIGAINAWRHHSGGLFNKSELNFLVSIANQTSMSIESIRLFQETARRAQEAHAIAEVGRDISSTLQLDAVLERIAQYAKELLRAETSAVYLLNTEGTLLQAIAAIGTEAKEIKNDPLPIGSGILGNIALQKTGEIVNDTLGDQRAIAVKGTEINPNEHIMGVPVLSKDQLTGLLAVWRTGEEEEFKSHELDFLSSLAQQAAVAIENARQFESEQRHFEEAEILRQSAEAITSSLDIGNVLNAILNNLSRVVPYDSAALFLIEGDMVRLTAGIGFPDNENVIDLLFSADNALLQEIWKSGKPLILEDAQADMRFKKWAAADQVRGWMGVPLSARGIMIGCITIDSFKSGAYNEHDAILASTFAHQAAAAIENARLYERSEHQVRQLTVLRDIDTAISSSFDLHVTLDFLTSHALKELDVDAAAILLYNPDLQALTPHSGIGFTYKRKSPSAYIRIGEGLAGQVALKRKPIHIPDLSQTVEDVDSSLVEESFKSYFGVPLIGKGEIKGVLEIYSRVDINPTTDWLNFLHTLAGQAAIAIDNVQLFKNLQRSNQELMLAYDTTLAGWGKALELRDKETQGHTNRVVKLTLELARRMEMDGEELTNILRGTLLHDIGKMGIPDEILNKPGPLSEEEWGIMRQHPQFAFDLINPIPYLRPAMDIPFSHHERWDGSGYPLGLKGKEIPLAARVFAVVDIYDALLNDRVYRDAWTDEKVIEYLKNASGIELDPNIVETFLDMIQEDHFKNQAE